MVTTTFIVDLAFICVIHFHFSTVPGSLHGPDPQSALFIKTHDKEITTSHELGHSPTRHPGPIIPQVYTTGPPDFGVQRRELEYRATLPG